MKQQWITIDAVPFVTQGKNFTITGTTGLSAGMQLFVGVLPQYYEDSSACFSTISGMFAVTAVQQGDGEKNLWSIPVNTTKWRADNYSAKVSGIEIEVTVRGEFILYPEGFPAPTTPTTVPQLPGFLTLSTIAGITAAAVLPRRVISP